VTVGGGCDAEGVPEGGDERAGVGVAARGGRAGDGAVRGEQEHGSPQLGQGAPDGGILGQDGGDVAQPRIGRRGQVVVQGRAPCQRGAPNQPERASRSPGAAVPAGSPMAAAQAMWASGRISRASAGR
jgi:hypothetical protein